MKDEPRDDDARDAVEALVEEFFAAQRRGDPVDRMQFARRVPGREAEFEELLATLALLESAVSAPIATGSAARASAPPARIGRFRLVRPIGRGGMGSVYEAVDDELGRRVALKVLSAAGSLEGREVTRFQREAEAAARLAHPNIVPIHAVGEDDGTHWIAMQLVVGESLDRRLRRAPEDAAARLAPLEVARLGIAVAEALAYAHGEGVLHRDVKPSNLLLDSSGAIFVTDFGLAKAEGSASLTRTGETIGTPRYMAPEAFAGWADRRTDVWGLGATLYELLAWRPAFDGGDRARLLKQISSVEPPPLRRLEPGVPQDLATIVHKCLQKEPGSRYATVQELADDLRRFVAGEPIRARAPSLAYRASLIARRHPTATLLVVLALAGGIGMTSLAAARARVAETRAERRFEELRKLAGSFLFEFHDAIRDLPGSTPARALVAKRALEYLGDLAKESGDDPELRRELAAAYQKVGDVQGNPYQPNVGDMAGARASYRKAIDLLEPVEASGRASDADRALLASACLIGGGIELVAGATDHALAMSARGLELRQRLARSDGSRGRREELATAYQFHAFNLAAAGRNDEALTALREQATLLDELRREAPEDAALRRAAGQNRYLMARQLDQRGAVEEARAAYRDAIALQRELLAADPKSTRLRRDLCWPLTDLAILERKAGAMDAALAAYRETLALSEELAAADPESVDGSLAVVRALNNLGGNLAASGKVDEGLAQLHRAIDRCGPIVAADPVNSFAARLLAKALINAADAHLKRAAGDDVATARALLVRGLALLEELEKAGRLPADDRDQLDRARTGIADCDARLSVSGAGR